MPCSRARPLKQYVLFRIFVLLFEQM
jgi:hypothetical protein